MTTRETWRGIAVLVLSVTVGLSLFTLIIGIVAGLLAPRSDGLAWIAGSIGLCLGIVSTYVTGSLFRRREGR